MKKTNLANIRLFTACEQACAESENISGYGAAIPNVMEVL